MKQVQVNDLIFSLIDQGTGQVIVFLHGFPLNSSTWSQQIQAFSTSHRVIAPDMRGHGRSSVTPGTVTMRDMADDLNRILDVLGIDDSVTLCGLSMGGYVSWEFWRNFGQRVARLILCDTKATNDSEEVARARQMMADQVVVAGSAVAAESMVPKLFATATRDRQPTLVAEVRDMILATDPDTIAATQRGMAIRIDMSPHLHEVSVPALVLCGADDVISPKQEMSRFAESMPNAAFVEIANAGHLAPLEQPAATNAAIRDFLANS